MRSVARSSRVSAPQAKSGDEASIPLDILTSEIVKKSSSLADHQQQATPAVMVVLVLTKMLGQVIDPLGKQGCLHLRRAGVALMGPVIGNNLCSRLHLRVNLN